VEVAMSNNYWEDDEDDFDTEVETDNGGNDLLKKLRKADRAKEKRIKELEAELGSFRKINTERTVKEILEQEGVKPSLVKYILKDLDSDVSADSVRNWLQENGEDFGYQSNREASKISDEDRQALSGQDSITEGALTPDRAQDLEMRIANAANQEELERILFSQ
jgi:hypothetical protein